MHPELTVTSEQINSLPLLLGILEDMGIRHLIDAHVTPHGHWQGISVGTAVTIWLCCLLQEELPRPAWSDVHKWQYALPDSGCDSERLHADDGLFFAGDYLAGQGRLHLALESGWAAADRIADWDASSTA